MMKKGEVRIKLKRIVETDRQRAREREREIAKEKEEERENQTVPIRFVKRYNNKQVTTTNNEYGR